MEEKDICGLAAGMINYHFSKYNKTEIKTENITETVNKGYCHCMNGALLCTFDDRIKYEMRNPKSVLPERTNIISDIVTSPLGNYMAVYGKNLENFMELKGSLFK